MWSPISRWFQQLCSPVSLAIGLTLALSLDLPIPIPSGPLTSTIEWTGKASLRMAEAGPSPPSDQTSQRNLEDTIIRLLQKLEEADQPRDSDGLPAQPLTETLAALLQRISEDLPKLRTFLEGQRRRLRDVEDIPCQNVRDAELPPDYLHALKQFQDPAIQCVYRSLAATAIEKGRIRDRLVIVNAMLDQFVHLSSTIPALPVDVAGPSFPDVIKAMLADVQEADRPFATFLERQARQLLPYHPPSCESIQEAQLPQSFRTHLQRLEDHEVICELKLTFTRLRYAIALATHQQRLMEEAKQFQGYSAAPVPRVQWEGDSCGCAPQVSKIVYGFYPFWQAGPNPQTIDFSVFSRIGYFAATFNERGQLLNRSHWQKTRPYPDFIDLAHKYRTNIDLVVYNAQWDPWGQFTPGETAIVIDQLTTNIVNTVNTPLNNYLVNALKPLVSFGMSPTRTMGDGVTLYFDFEGLRHADPALVFSSLYLFIDQLRDKLSQAGKGFTLNLMFPYRSLIRKDGVYYPSNLKKLADDVDLFLVLLDDPIESTMKELRYEIEKHFPSPDQRVITRKIVPVVSPPAQSETFAEWLTYFEDNFGGAGLWPMPIGEEAPAPAFRSIIREDFLEDSDGFVCSLVCPNRWISRIVLFLVLITAGLYGMLSLWIYELRRLAGTYTRILPIMVLLTTFLLGLTVWCDPYWRDRQTEMLILLLIIGTGITLFMTARKRRQAIYP